MEGRHSKIDLKSSLKSVDLGAGKVYRNPFLNFLRDFRKSHKNKLDVVEITKRAAQLWRIMNERERSPYINMSRQAPKKRRCLRKIRTQKIKSEPAVTKKGMKGDTVDQCKCTTPKSLKISRTPRKRKSRRFSVKKSKAKVVTKSTSGYPRRRKCVCGRFVKFA